MSIPIRLAADIGGSFTDVVFESEAGFQSTKVLTTLNQPEIGVMRAIDELLRCLHCFGRSGMPGGNRG